MKKNKLVLFFTDKKYRFATLELLKIKFTTLPGIKHIISLCAQWRFYKKTQHMDSWERYVSLKNAETWYETFSFTCKLIRLYASIMAEGEYRNDGDFLKNKQEVLECKLMAEEELREFREWVENITPDERDGSLVKDVFDRYTANLAEAN